MGEEEQPYPLYVVRPYFVQLRSLLSFPSYLDAFRKFVVNEKIVFLKIADMGCYVQCCLMCQGNPTYARSKGYWTSIS